MGISDSVLQPQYFPTTLSLVCFVLFGDTFSAIYYEGGNYVFLFAARKVEVLCISEFSSVKFCVVQFLDDLTAICC